MDVPPRETKPGEVAEFSGPIGCANHGHHLDHDVREIQGGIIRSGKTLAIQNPVMCHSHQTILNPNTEIFVTDPSRLAKSVTKGSPSESRTTWRAAMTVEREARNSHSLTRLVERSRFAAKRLPTPFLSSKLS